MGRFLDAPEHPATRSRVRPLLRGLALLLSSLGWMLAAVGLSTIGLHLIALVGLAAAFAGGRAPKAAAFVEGLVLLAVLSLATDAIAGFVVLAGVFVVLGRVAAFALARLDVE